MTKRLDHANPLPVYSTVCSTCRRLRATVPGRTCDAFPGGIPNVIWRGENLHREPFRGDHGLQYEQGRPHGV